MTSYPGRRRVSAVSIAVVRWRRSRAWLLIGIKAVHTVVWLTVETALGLVLYDGLVGRRRARTAIAAAVVAGESLVYLGNGARCPMTDMAERLGAERGSVTDIFLPAWFAERLPAIHVPIVATALWLHLRPQPST